MNILVITIPHSVRHSGDYTMFEFPLGMAYVLASLRKKIKGANVLVSDFIVEHVVSEDAMKEKLRSIKCNFNPDYVLYGAMITRFSYIRTLSFLIKDMFPYAKQVLGGSAAGSGYKFFIDDRIIDYIVVGEGEDAIVDILSGNWPNNKSIITPASGLMPVRQAIENIDAIPMPSYKDFDVGKYIDNNHYNTGWRYMPMIASRGCPFACTFCYPNFGSTLRLREESQVISEMAYLGKDYSVEAVCFWDEIQFLNKGWMENFCRKLIDTKINMKWVCASRASLFQEKDIPLLRLAKKAGCLRIAIGIESGNQDILDKMNKNTKVKQIEDAIRIIRKAGIKATGSILAGYPGETSETLRDTVKFVNGNLLKTSFYCLIPLPGSKIYDDCVSNNWIKNERAYLENVSGQGGDASHIVINLTDMDDQTYRNEIGKANESVKEIKLKNMIEYYGLGMGLVNYVINLYKTFYMKKLGRKFETP